MRQIYVNLPVKDLETSKRFFQDLGFEIDPRFTNEDAAAVVFGEGVYAMLLTEGFFRTFMAEGDRLADGATEVMNCLSAESREEVDELVARALEAGGSEHKPKMEQGPMYGGSFKDPDGHVWEVLHMSELPDS